MSTACAFPQTRLPEDAGLEDAPFGHAHASSVWSKRTPQHSYHTIQRTAKKICAHTETVLLATMTSYLFRDR